jgi:hypothetical protein
VRKRRLLLVAGALAVLALIVALLHLRELRPGVTRANFQQVQVGMSVQEVEAILGGGGCPDPDPGRKGLLWATWSRHGYVVEVVFDRDRKVREKRLLEAETTLWDRISFCGLACDATCFWATL